MNFVHNNETCHIPFCKECLANIKQLGKKAKSYNLGKITRSVQKCDLCGSTAIDHTEAHCSSNRLQINLRIS